MSAPVTQHTTFTPRADGAIEVRCHPVDCAGPTVAAFTRQGYEMVKCKVRGRVARMIFVLAVVACTRSGEPTLLPDSPPAQNCGCPNRNDGRCIRVSIPRETWNEPGQLLRVLTWEPTMEHVEFVLNSFSEYCDGRPWASSEGTE